MSVDPSNSFVLPTVIDGHEDAGFSQLSCGTPIGSGSSKDDWDPLSLGLAVRVPIVPEHNLLRPSHFSVRFRNLRQGSHSRGVHLGDLFRPASEQATLGGAKDTVLVGFGGPTGKLRFRINWPGYESERTTISSVSDSGGPLTRLGLARNIMYAYGGFFRKVAAERIRPSQVGPYNIALDQRGGAKGPDSEGVKLSELHLVKFREPIPGDNHWVAEIDIVRAQV